MPVTPYHFGPGVLLKAAAPRSVSLLAFAAANVAIDVESLVNLLAGRYPVHATLHTFAASLAVGLVVGAAVGWIGRWRRLQSAEFGMRASVIGGVLGGVTHPFLDGIMHADIRPFLPLSDENPLYRIVGLDALHGVCVALGIAGAVLLVWRRWSRASPS